MVLMDFGFLLNTFTELHFYFQLQRFIKQEMEKNEFTAALANSELVFFVVCFLIYCLCVF